MVKEAVLLNGISELAIMKMDVLDGLKAVKICTAYRYKGKLLREFPHDLEALRKVRPVYKEMPGWPESANKPRRYNQLHPNARAYLARLQDVLGARVSLISVGSCRKETIFIQ
jgi:adenylosuccinate synthase